jgi:DNA sulfur modification protein DndB
MMGDIFQVPAMRGAMGDWVYYVTLLPFFEACDRIKRAEEVHKSKLLREMIQRALTPRSRVIAAYLESQPQRFFNAVVVGVYGGSPEWHRVEIKQSQLFDPSALLGRVSESIGILQLRGDEKLFAIDGQHRIEGIKEFARKIGRTKLLQLEDELSAIFVAHRTSQEGLQRTRRLFATLNRYAKPVSFTEIIALDEDDVVAIACRNLLEEHSLFQQGRVSLEKRKSLAPHDRTNFTSLIAMYQATEIYLMDRKRSQWNQFKSVRPADEAVVRDYTRRAQHFWDLLVRAVPRLQKIERLSAAQMLPKSYRNERGGDFIFRPIFPPLVAMCLRKATASGMSEQTFFARFRRIPRQLNKPPWLGVVWDGANMLVAEKNQELAKRIILWMVDCDPQQIKITEADLRRRLAEVLNKEPREVTVPNKVCPKQVVRTFSETRSSKRRRK